MEQKDVIMFIQNNGGLVVSPLAIFFTLIFWKLGLFFELSLSWSIFAIFFISVFDPLSTYRFSEKGIKESNDFFRCILEKFGNKVGSIILYIIKVLTWTIVYLITYFWASPYRFAVLLFILFTEYLNTVWNSDFNPFFKSNPPTH